MARGASATRDRLSNLPDSILEIIFSGISIREMVRTSVLSTKWRYKWISFPTLIFDDECIPGLFFEAAHRKLVKIINHVLLVHRSPIRTFKLASTHLESCSMIDTWVSSLLFDPLMEFELQISPSSPRHTIPRCLFSVKHLNHLTLGSCVIPEPPLSFKSFPFLTTLFLESVTLSDATLKCLLSSCPELKSLTLEHTFGHDTHIELSNPKLNYVSITARSSIIISLKDLKLLYALFDTYLLHDSERGTIMFSNFCGSLLSIQELYLGSRFMKCFAHIDVPKRLPFTYHHLKSISFDLDPNYGKEILVALCLLNCSPNLHKLQIVFISSSASSIHLQETEDQLENTSFNSLRVVSLCGFRCGEIQLLLAKLLLANSPVLGTMEIHSAASCYMSDLSYVMTQRYVRKQLHQFRRASPQAKIMCY